MDCSHLSPHRSNTRSQNATQNVFDRFFAGPAVVPAAVGLAAGLAAVAGDVRPRRLVPAADLLPGAIVAVAAGGDAAAARGLTPARHQARYFCPFCFLSKLWKVFWGEGEFAKIEKNVGEGRKGWGGGEFVLLKSYEVQP